jgi:gluconolactonase
MTDVVIEATGLAHPEGPASLPDGSIVFVETFREQVSRWRPGEGVTRYALCGGGPNACCTGLDGVYITQMGRGVGSWTSSRPTSPSIQKIDWRGGVRTIATQVDGNPLKAPNDLCFGIRGNLLFTDPDVFDQANPRDGYIYSLNPDGTCDFVVELGPVFPNGIVALPDDSIAWVESYTRRVRRRSRDGAVTDLATLPEGHMPDGFKAGADGRLYVTTIMSGGLDVVPLRGGESEFIRTGGHPLNCLFVEEDLLVADDGALAYADPALVTANGGRLLRVHVGVRGAPLFAGQVASFDGPSG